MSIDDQKKKAKKEAMKALRKFRKEWITNAAARVKAQKKELRSIKDQLKKEAGTVPQISKNTGLPAARTLWYLAALKKYGEIAEGEKEGNYFRYALIEKAVENES